MPESKSGALTSLATPQRCCLTPLLPAQRMLRPARAPRNPCIAAGSSRDDRFAPPRASSKPRKRTRPSPSCARGSRAAAATRDAARLRDTGGDHALRDRCASCLDRSRAEKPCILRGSESRFNSGCGENRARSGPPPAGPARDTSAAAGRGASGPRRCPPPRRVPPKTKNGTSAPERTRRARPARSGPKPVSHSRFSASSTVAASELPPPRPAAHAGCASRARCRRPAACRVASWSRRARAHREVRAPRARRRTSFTRAMTPSSRTAEAQLVARVDEAEDASAAGDSRRRGGRRRAATGSASPARDSRGRAAARLTPPSAR